MVCPQWLLAQESQIKIDGSIVAYVHTGPIRTFICWTNHVRRVREQLDLIILGGGAKDPSMIFWVAAWMAAHGCSASTISRIPLSILSYPWWPHALTEIANWKWGALMFHLTSQPEEFEILGLYQSYHSHMMQGAILQCFKDHSVTQMTVNKWWHWLNL